MVVEVGVFSLRNPIDKPDFPSEVVEVGVGDKHAKREEWEDEKVGEA